MPEPHWCPVDGCDYPPDQENTSHDSVRSHVVAMSDGDHDWSQLKSQIKRQGEGGSQQASETDGDEEPPEASSELAQTAENSDSEPPDEGGSELATDPPDDPEEPEQPNEQAEASENSETEQSDSPMVSDDELARQRQSNDDPAESDDEPDTTPSPTGASGGWELPIPVSSTTLMMGAATVLIFALVYAYARSGSSGSGGADDVQDDDQNDGNDEVVDDGEVELFDD